MQNIFFAWELGGGFGHVGRDMPLALACAEAGYTVSMASADLRASALTPSHASIRLQASPQLVRTSRPNATLAPGPFNFAHLLGQLGWDDTQTLAQAVRQWRKLLTESRARALVCDHAPTALLAARIESIPALVISNGFEIPSPVVGQPPLKPWLRLSSEQLTRHEQSVVQVVNQVLTQAGCAPIQQLWDLYGPGELLLTTLAELDHFGPRSIAPYSGPLSLYRPAPVLNWQTPSRHILLYARAGMPGLEALLCGLEAVDAEVIGLIPDHPPDWPAHFTKLHLSTRFVDLGVMLPGADLVISSGSGTAGDAVRQGVPALVMPQVLEQYHAGEAIARLGAGLVLPPSQSAPAYADIVKRALCSTELRQSAIGFSKKYASHNPQAALKAQWQALHRLLER